MMPFKFSLPASGGFPIVIAVLWLVYVVIYWRAMVLILKAGRFDATDKILWFLVITMAPVIGLITFHVMCPPQVRDAADVP